jgi:hypothetical protein
VAKSSSWQKLFVQSDKTSLHLHRGLLELLIGACEQYILECSACAERNTVCTIKFLRLEKDSYLFLLTVYASLKFQTIFIKFPLSLNIPKS